MARRLGVLAVVVALVGIVSCARATAASLPTAARAGPASLPTGAPLINARTHRPLSCPDPSVVHARRPRFDYFLYCTSDGAPDAFPFYGSRDLVHWTPLGSVFPSGHEPAFALPTVGQGSHGRFWAPSINFIDGRWVLYFSAAYNAASRALPAGTLNSGTMVLGVATSRALGGPWQASLLHYPRQLNSANSASDQELTGGDIDPAAVQDPVTGERLLVWAQQREQIFLAGLSSNGLSIGPEIQLAFGQSEPWECDPTNHVCTVEGPQPVFHDGRLFVLYSGASTWDASYTVGVASAPAPFSPFVKDSTPVLHSGGGFLGPGGVSDPTVAPDGQTVVLYHALRAVDPGHRSGQRLLMLGVLGWNAAGEPTVDDGTP